MTNRSRMEAEYRGESGEHIVPYDGGIMFIPKMEKKMTLFELMTMLKKQSDANGWNKVDRRPLEWHSCIASEIGEMTDAVRDNLPPVCYFDESGQVIGCEPEDLPPQFKPEGECIEMADMIIWALVYATEMKWDLEGAILAKAKFNQTRGERHGGKLK